MWPVAFVPMAAMSQDSVKQKGSLIVEASRAARALSVRGCCSANGTALMGLQLVVTQL